MLLPLCVSSHSLIIMGFIPVDLIWRSNEWIVVVSNSFIHRYIYIDACIEREIDCKLSPRMINDSFSKDNQATRIMKKKKNHEPLSLCLQSNVLLARRTVGKKQMNVQREENTWGRRRKEWMFRSERQYYLFVYVAIHWRIILSNWTQW